MMGVMNDNTVNLLESKGAVPANTCSNRFDVPYITASFSYHLVLHMTTMDLNSNSYTTTLSRWCGGMMRDGER